ncbi:MAG TPA: type II secretion system protein [Stellaceae bacterium]|nr:type II secretion system protein [Stellaceae bacterium]
MAIRRRIRPGGFTLVEVLVAFAIAAVLLVALLRSFSGGVAGSARAGAYAEATTLAESTLETLGTSVKLSDGMNAATDDGPYRIAVTARLYTPPDRTEPAQLYVVPYEVAVTVTWREGQRAQSITLRTLRLALRQ